MNCGKGVKDAFKEKLGVRLATNHLSKTPQKQKLLHQLWHGLHVFMSIWFLILF